MQQQLLVSYVIFIFLFFKCIACGSFITPLAEANLPDKITNTRLWKQVCVFSTDPSCWHEKGSQGLIGRGFDALAGGGQQCSAGAAAAGAESDQKGWRV